MQKFTVHLGAGEGGEGGGGGRGGIRDWDFSMVTNYDLLITRLIVFQ